MYTIHACRKPYCPGSGILLSQKRHLQEKKELLYNQKKKEAAMNKIRYGIISCASIVPRFTQGMELTETGTVCAIASRDPAKARKLAEELSIPKAYGDYQALLDDPDIDAVYIPLINSMHYPYAKKALLAGKHVLAEKPFVIHSREAEELFTIAREKKLFLTETVKTPFLPLYEKIMEIIQSGQLGSVRFMDFRQSYTSGPYTAGWNTEKDCGGGVLYGNEAYFFYMAEMLNGPIESVSGSASFFDSGAEKQCAVTARFRNNSLAVWAVSQDVLFDNGLTIYFDHGRIFIPDFWKAGTAVIEAEGKEQETIHCPCSFEFQFELSHYNACIREGRWSSPITAPEKTIRYIRFCEDLKKAWSK